jgi:hypothetical protein
LLFTAPSRLAAGEFISQRITSKAGGPFLDAVSRGTFRLPLCDPPQNTAYGLTQAFASGKDVPYEACITAVSACVAKAQAGDAWAQAFKQRYIQVLFPVVITDAPLFECYLDDASVPTVREIAHGLLAWRHPLSAKAHTLIHVLTPSHLTTFSRDALTTATSLLSTGDIIASIPSVIDLFLTGGVA